MRLLQPAPRFVRSIKLHVLAEQPAALVSGDRSTLLLDLLADCKAVADVLPRLLDGGHAAVGADHSVTVCTHARGSDDVLIVSV